MSDHPWRVHANEGDMALYRNPPCSFCGHLVDRHAVAEFARYTETHKTPTSDDCPSFRYAHVECVFPTRTAPAATDPDSDLAYYRTIEADRDRAEFDAKTYRHHLAGMKADRDMVRRQKAQVEQDLIRVDAHNTILREAVRNMAFALQHMPIEGATAEFKMALAELDQAHRLEGPEPFGVKPEPPSPPAKKGKKP